ncbi:ribosomal protein S6 [Aphanomyces invadans]|uniref:Ribosomal protein S6 n=1 Tax=Aphanomyces invadans TaxID=157072 RepID=A0A024UP91_9STRA|nr:ribosomal protein S6 [Aphanomyces invadans]ETW07990.1 ribosomal protein S6 [Aphanomyces invadans]|eukprot:XP_008864083.1 ribosomal protein S6 [Aphanomyces invadans]
MVLYKQVILTNLKSSPADTAKAFKELASFILSKGGVVRDVSHRGHRTLGYAIDDRRWGGTFERHREAKLLVKTFETSPATLKELEAKMKLSYSILRFTTFKVKKDPLRDVIKASATAPETEPVTPFNWKEFKAASTDDNTKVFEQEYVFEANGTSSDKHVPSKFDLMSQEDKDDLADWLMSKTQPEGALKQEAAKKDEFNLYGSVDDKDEEEADDEEDEDDDDDIAEWEDEEFEPTQDVPEWKRDSSYEPERPSKKGKDK